MKEWLGVSNWLDVRRVEVRGNKHRCPLFAKNQRGVARLLEFSLLRWYSGARICGN